MNPGNAVSQMNRFQNGDVLVYIANDYDNDIGPVCDQLKARGVVVLPVYLGKQVFTNLYLHVRSIFLGLYFSTLTFG